jgi:hypothetical protein
MTILKHALKPKHITADAAFDAYSMYEGRPLAGIAAILLNLNGHLCVKTGK